MTDLQLFSAGALTVVLGIAGIAKLRAPERFRQALRSYDVIPPAAIGTLVYAVPAVELAAAALQWIRPLQPAISVAIAAIFVAFTLLLLRSLLTGGQADCGCFGSAAPEKVSWFSIARNAALITVALAGVYAGDAPSDAGLPAVLSGLGAGLLIVVLDQTLTLLSRPPAARRTH